MSVVTLKTTYGDIVIELNHEKAPKTAENFVNYVKQGFYKGTIFHRVIKGFMIQGGGLTATLDQKETNSPIENEADNGLVNDRGTIAMARTQDPHSATAQFFINTVDNDFLNFRSKDISGYGYCVFGKVIEGLEVVDKIESVKTGTRGFYQDVPTETIEIIDATVSD
ncbi:MAG: peptidyl-prolyl cis-trans isomerase [Succinivibrio sp.]|nr:peptidyl-prolyl cis-trans isomerase [Succinivibrio sp.]